MINSSIFYIVILNYNAWEDTIECINSLGNSSFKDFQIILLDNCSTDNSEKSIRSFFITNNFDFNFFNLKNEDSVFLPSKKIFNKPFYYPITFLQTGINNGFASGNNFAINILKNSVLNSNSNILFLNPDTIVNINSLGVFSKVDLDYFLGSCSIYDYYCQTKFLGYGAYNINLFFGLVKRIYSAKKLDDIDYVYGGALFTNLNTISKIGFLPEEYFLYWEETDWCTKAKSLSIPLLIFNDIIIYDKVGTSIGRGFFAFYFFTRNKLIYFKKFNPISLISIVIFDLFNCLRFFIKGEKEISKGIFLGIINFFKGEKGKKSFN